MRRELGPMPRSRIVGDGLGAEAEDGEIELGIRKGRARVRQLWMQGPSYEDASKHVRAHTPGSECEKQPPHALATKHTVRKPSCQRMKSFDWRNYDRG